jgi:hypothetical protein
MQVAKKFTPKDTFITDYELMDLANRIVSRFIANRYIPKREKEDVQMAIIEKFLTNKSRIIDRFQGKSKTSTYCFAVLNRMCLEIIRKDIKHWNLTEGKHKEIREDCVLNLEDNLIIKDEIRLLKNIIALFFDEKEKIVLFLAYYYQLNIYSDDINNYCLGKCDNNFYKLFTINNKLSKATIFANLTIAVNKIENKNLKNDATRIWLNKTINTIISKLNYPFNRANYTKESLQILFEYYYNEKGQ